VTADVTLKRMEVSNLPAVAELERLAGDVRWTEAQLSAELAKPISRYWIALSETDEIIGYTGGWLIPPELQMANIVIHPQFRCKGIGRRLLEVLIKDAESEGCHQGTLEVRASNAHAQSLYRAAGFKETSRRSQMYQNPVEDAVLMEKSW